MTIRRFAACCAKGSCVVDLTSPKLVMEAIELIEQSEVHACLIDFHMPKLNGVEVIRHIRQRSNQTPCVLMSADLDETIRAQAQQVSVYEVLSKPIRLKQISDLICNALSDVYGWRPA